MATDYILFIHGVNTRDEKEDPKYADMLIEGIKSQYQDFVDIPLYWGDVNEATQKQLLE